MLADQFARSSRNGKRLKTGLRLSLFAGGAMLASFGDASAGAYAVTGYAAQGYEASATPSAGGSYLGGGFIEMLATGGAAQETPLAPAPAPSRRYVAYAPQPQRVVDPIYRRAEVDYEGGERAGSLVVDTQNKFLYFVQGGGRAIRYGIGVGRPGFEWSGVKTVSRKAEWPDWTPPREMLARRPDLPGFMPGGPDNPLGARALYLGSSLYRIHGTNEPYTIGTNVSSGCIRMMNDDVIDLYARVNVGAKVLVR